MGKRYTEKCVALGLNILHYRKLRGMTQAQAAEASGITEQQFQRIETSISVPKLTTLFGIADALNIPVHKLLEFRD